MWFKRIQKLNARYPSIAMLMVLFAFIGGAYYQNKTNFSRLELEKTPEITFSNGETISNETDGTLTFGPAGSANFELEDITLENDETITNATDAIVAVTYNDDAALLGTLRMVSTNDSANMADNDHLDIVATAYNDSLDAFDFAEIEFVFTDVTNAGDDEDSKINFKTTGAGASKTPLYLSTDDAVFADNVSIGGTVTLENSETIDNATNGTIQLVTPVSKFAYDAAAYATLTIADAGGATWDMVSDGTAAWSWGDPTTYTNTVLVDTTLTAELFNYCADTSATNDSYGGTLAPAIDAYNEGLIVVVKFAVANTGACTLALNGMAAKAIKITHDGDPGDNFFEVGSVAVLVYDGTNFQCNSVAAN